MGTSVTSEPARRIRTRPARGVDAAANVPRPTSELTESGDAERTKRLASILTNESAVHRAWSSTWDRLDRAHKGGVYAVELLRRFKWENEERGDKEAYADRQRMSAYPEYVAERVGKVTGFLTERAPTPFGDNPTLSFGELGTVGGQTANPLTGGDRLPTRAELAYYNIDGVGIDGSQWKPWWRARMADAMVFGHTWILVESPAPIEVPDDSAEDGVRRVAARTFADEMAGQRSYLVAVKPGDVWDHHYVRGELEYLVHRLVVRDPKVDPATGLFQDRSETVFYFHVRRGCTRFGDEFIGGGWWKFGADFRLIGQGTYDSTNGRIPYVGLFWRRDDGVPTHPAMSAPAVQQLAAIAEADMNIESAADNEVLRSCRGIDFISGVDPAGLALASAKMEGGSTLIPLIPSVPVGPNGTPGVPAIQMSGAGAIAAAQSADARLAAKRAGISAAGGGAQSSAADTSGVSKQMSFDEIVGPRLAGFATEVETAQNSVLALLVQRWMGVRSPSASTKWPTKFPLMDSGTAITEIFSALNLVDGAVSPTLVAKAVELMLVERNVSSDPEELATIRAEIVGSLEAAQRQREAERKAVEDGTRNANDAADAAIESARADRETPPTPPATA